MKFSKYRIIDIVFSSLLCLMGLVGFFLIPTMVTYNIFLIVYVLLNVCLLPIYFYLMLNNKFPICIFVPIGFIIAFVLQFRSFETENNVYPLVLVCAIISNIFAILTTIFIYAHRSIPKKENSFSLTDNLSFRKNVFKRLILYIRDAVIVFIITIGMLFYSNVAFDSSNIIEFKVTIVDTDERSWKHDRTFYIEYSGNDSNVVVTSMLAPNYIADTVSIGDEMLLKYRKGFFNDHYFWIDGVISKK